jgi:hypothetical protein
MRYFMHPGIGGGISVNYRYVAAICFSLLMLSGCSTNQRYSSLSHERLVSAAIEAVSQEANVAPGEIKRTDLEEKGGVITVLESPYIQYSRIETKVDSTEERASCPRLEVRIVTNDVLYTRHKEWEHRIQELVCLKLRARKHGHESKPTALPTLEPTVTPPTAPAPKG